MRLSSYGPRARTEFRRLVLESQISRGEAELAARRSRRQRYRSRRVERRLAELHALLRELEGIERPARRSSFGSRFAGGLVTALWVTGAVVLGTEVVRHGVHTIAVTVGVLAMLGVSLLWFALAVARVPVSGDGGRETGSAHPEPPA
jgi:hypothetical protein